MTFHQNRQARLNGNNLIEKTLIYLSTTTQDNPNTSTWLPIRSVHEHGNYYRIIESSSDPEHEYWQFGFDEVVDCKNNKFAENEFGLIAVEKCQHKAD
jgi:hypothetical protein